METEVLANRYQVVGSLGEGAMGVVLHVQDTANDRPMALKAISAKVGANDKTILQFKQEFRLMTLLRHRNCCEVYDYGQLPDGAPYFTMEIVPGHGLDELLPLDEATFRSVFAQLLHALGYLHRLGFVHRDIKSANVRVMADGTVKLMDYGLMEYAGRSNAPISGTPSYMAPEVVKRGPIDQRTDLYSAGVLAYELLTGQLPFGNADNLNTAIANASRAPLASTHTEAGQVAGSQAGASQSGGTTAGVMAVLRAHVSDRPVPPSALCPDLNPELERVVLRLMAKEPIERYRSTSEVLAALGVEDASGVGGNLLTSPMVGRESEVKRLSERLEAIAQRGQGGVMALIGPTGVGKSRLVDELRYAAQLENVGYALGGCQEQGGAPYGPWIAALGAVLSLARQAARADLDSAAPILVKLLPQLGVPPAPDLDPPAKEKARLQATVVTLLLAIARTKPLMLVLEDWQWADPLSRELLTLLSRTRGDASLQVVVTTRPGEAGGDDLGCDADMVPVSSLEREAVGRMVASMLGTADLDATFVEKVTTFSDGNPFYVKELLDRLVQDRTLVYEGGRWNTDVELTPDKLPKNLKGLLVRKITQLSNHAQRLAHAGAVVGAVFDLDLLQDVTGLEDEPLFVAMEVLALTKVFEQVEAGRYRFVQDQLRDTLYETIAPEERITLHTVVAEALERRLGVTPLAEAPVSVLTAIATHYMAGDRPERGINVALVTGKALTALYANLEAKHFLDLGLELVRAAEAAGDTALEAVRLDYLSSLGLVSRLLGEVERGAAVYTEALPLAERLWAKSAVADLMTSLGKCHQMIGNLPEALSWCGKSLALAVEMGDEAAQARSLLTSCRIHFYRGSQGEAIADTERALQVALNHGDRFREAEAKAFLGYISIAAGPATVAQGITHLNDAVALLTDLHDRVGLQNALNLLGNAQNMLGDPQAARATFERNLQIVMDLGLRDDELVCYLNLAICAIDLGNFRAGVEYGQKAFERGQLNQNAFHMGLALTFRATASCYLGQFVGALEEADQALKMAIEANNKYVETIAMGYKVEICLVIGHLGMAKTAAKNLIALIKETGNTEPELRMNAFLGEIVARQGDLGGGREYVRLALNEARAIGAASIEARALKVRAWIAMQTGEWAEAKADAEAALMLARSLGMKYLSAELEGILGEISIATKTGDPINHFELMAERAAEMESDLLLGLAEFGLAATAGNPVQAVPRVKRAQELLNKLVSPLDEDTRLCFSAIRERGRVLSGNFIGGFLPRSAQMDIKVSLPGIRLGGGGGGLFSSGGMG